MLYSVLYMQGDYPAFDRMEVREAAPGETTSLHKINAVPQRTGILECLETLATWHINSKPQINV